jgi:hypothetical protein
MQSLSIFGATQCIHFVFQTLEEFEIHLKKIKPTGAHPFTVQPGNPVTQSCPRPP